MRRIAWLLIAGALAAQAQVCRLSVAGLNRERRVMGPVHAECPSDPFHSAPFGNWGATSNYGIKINGHQFDGWCRNIRVCDNNGSCRNVCGDRWYQWNSCTDVREFAPPNCDLYNDKDCTEQKTTQGVNVMSTKTVDVPVRCPIDTNLDGQADDGGCRDLRQFDPGENFVSLYELDPLSPDQLVQTLYFPRTPIPMTCEVLGCSAAGSEWVSPVSYADPASPAKVYAELAAVVNSGSFVNVNQACPLLQTLVHTVSAASFAEGPVAAGSLASAFGSGLNGLLLRVRDALGADRIATLLYTSAGQVNFLVPDGTAPGLATITASSGPQALAVGSLEIARVSPGIFSANSSGRDVASAIALRVKNGVATSEPVFVCAGLCVGRALDVTDGEVYLQLFGTGIRGRASEAAVSVRIGGQPVEVLYAGPQSEFLGVDQINVRLPATLAGSGEVEIEVAVEGHSANVTTLLIR